MMAAPTPDCSSAVNPSDPLVAGREGFQLMHSYSVTKGAQFLGPHVALDELTCHDLDPAGLLRRKSVRCTTLLRNSAFNYCVIVKLKEIGTAKGNRESKKPKKEKIKTIAAAPSQKTPGWQPTFGSGKKK
jgi:hypothetical protein